MLRVKVNEKKILQKKLVLWRVERSFENNHYFISRNALTRRTSSVRRNETKT